MKHLLTTLFAALTLFCGAQSISVSYTLDTIGGRDSFFLVETVSRQIEASTRPQQTTTSVLFRDTSEFSAYISRMRTDRANLQTRIDQLEAQASLLDTRLLVIQNLRDSVLPSAGAMVQPRAPAPTPPSSRQGVRDFAIPKPKAIVPRKEKIRKN